MNPKTILLVEKNTPISTSTEPALIDLGYRVINACYGDNASEILTKNVLIDLVLLDIDFGREENGIHLAREILQQRSLPVIFLASHFQQDFAAKTGEISDYVCVQKNSDKIVLQSSLEMTHELFEVRNKDFENSDQLSGEVYQALVNYNHDGIMLVTMEGSILKANPAACQMFATTEKELLGCEMAGLAYLNNSIQDFLRESQVHSGPFTTELTLVRRDGSNFNGELTCVIQHTGEENANIFIRDVTASKQAQKGLLSSEEHLLQIASVLRVAIWIRDVNTRKVLYVNPAFEELFGMSRESFYSDPDTFYNAIHPEDKKWLRKGEIGRSQEHRIIRPDGSICWVWGRNFPVRNEAGEIYRTATIVEDITERKQAEEELRVAYVKVQNQVKEIQSLHSILSEQAIRDSLTGLFNRRYLIDMLEGVIENARCETHSVSLVMIDIDNFKLVNDTYGHLGGDLVLQRLAQHLSEYARASDIICRYGGDEFVLVLPKIQPRALFQRINTLRCTFQKLKVIYNGMEIQTTLSIGIAVFPTHGQTSQELLTAADKAMYTAKRGDKNSVVLLGME